MSITVNAEAVRKVANQRVDGELAEQFSEFSGRKGSGVRPLGSRITTKQVEVAAECVTQAQIDILRGDDERLQALRIYAETGDQSKLSGEQSETLKKLVAACRERAIETAQTPGAGESQARRFWPRKVAAIIAQHDAQPPAPEPEPEPVEGEGEASSTDESDTPSSDETKEEAPKQSGRKKS
jgi:hypothetical protein